MKPSLPPTTVRDRELLDRLSQHEPLSTSELHLLFFTGIRTCRRRLTKLEAHDLLTRVYPTRSNRGGSAEALWFLSANGRRMIGAPVRRPPGLSIPDLEHRRAAAAFFLALVERSLTRREEGLYNWLGEQQAQQGTGASVRPDGYGRYLLPDGEITFYLEVDRGSEPARRVKGKLDSYRHALAGDPHRDRGNILLVCEGRRRLSNLARCAPPARRGCGAPPTASATRSSPAATSSELSGSCPLGLVAPGAALRTASGAAGATLPMRARHDGGWREPASTPSGVPAGNAGQDPRSPPAARRARGGRALSAGTRCQGRQRAVSWQRGGGRGSPVAAARGPHAGDERGGAQATRRRARRAAGGLAGGASRAAACGLEIHARIWSGARTPSTGAAMTRRAALAIAADSAAEPVRVATYTRISTDEERQPNSLEAQRVRLEAFVESQPEWRIERRYEDQFTGTVIDRPALTRLLRDAKLDRFDVLLVYRVDRLARSIRGLAQIIDELDQAGVIFRSATEPFDTGTPAGRMMVQMLGVFAEFERALIVERITAGLERKAARGGWCGGRRPYGSTSHADRDHLQRNTTEAPLVPVIFDHYVNGQEGSSMLAKWLNASGYRTKNGRPWSSASVLTVLRNRSYLGEIYYRGSWYPAPHEPLIPTELFDRAQAILTERGEDRSQRRTNASEYLLTGRVRCGRCGQAYIGTAAHGRNGRYTYYTCFTRMRYGTKHCANDRLPAERLEQAVTRRLWKVLEDGDLINQRDRADIRAADRSATDEQTSRATPRCSASSPRHAPRWTATSARSRTARCPRTPAPPASQRSTSRPKRSKAEPPNSPRQPTTTEHPERVTPADLDALRHELRSALEHSTPARTKTVLQAMIDTIRVDARDHIEPTFRVPAVRRTMRLRWSQPGSNRRPPAWDQTSVPSQSAQRRVRRLRRPAGVSARRPAGLAAKTFRQCAEQK